MNNNFLSDDFLDDFEEELQQFYFDVIRDEKDVRKVWHVIGMRRALKEISQYLSYIRYDNPSKRCAYMLKHGPLLTSSVAKYFLQVIQNNAYVFQNALRRGRIAICCLGGGPASDAVAIVRVIRALYQPRWHETRQTLKIYVTVVDVTEDWEVTTKNVLQCLEDTPRFFGVNEVELSYAFRKADLSDGVNEEVGRSIREADLVSMNYFLSSVNRSKGKDKSLPIIEKVMLTMKKDSVLFFMNSAADHHYKLLNTVTEKLRYMIKIYGPLVDEFQTLSMDSVKEFLELYSKHFYRCMCMTDGFVSVSAWYKPKVVGIKGHIHGTVSNKPLPRKTETEEESFLLMAKIKAYRGTVQRLLEITFDSASWQPRSADQSMDDVTEKPSEYDSQQSRTKSGNSPGSKTAVNCPPEYSPQTKLRPKVGYNTREFYNRSHLKNEMQDCVSDARRENMRSVKENVPTSNEVVLCIEKVISWMEKQSEANDVHLTNLLHMKQYVNKKRFASKEQSF